MNLLNAGPKANKNTGGITAELEGLMSSSIMGDIFKTNLLKA